MGHSTPPFEDGSPDSIYDERVIVCAWLYRSCDRKRHEEKRTEKPTINQDLVGKKFRENLEKGSP